MSSATPRWMIVFLASIIAITPLSVDMYLPAMDKIATEFDSHIGMVQQSLSTYLVGLGLGMLLFGPLADKFGRRPLALIGLGGFFLSSLALYWSDTIEHFVALRFVQAFIGAAATVVVPGIVRHLYQENTAKGLSYMAMIMMLAPMIAPSIGSALLLLGSWRYIFLLVAIYAAIVWVIALFKLPEIPRSDQVRNASLLKTLTNYGIVFRHREARVFVFCMLACAIAMFAYVTGISFVYINYYGISETLFGVYFALTISCILLGNFINSRLSPRIGSPRMLRRSAALGIAMTSALTLVVILDGSIYLFLFFVAVTMACISIASINTDALILMNFPHNTGTATAVTGTIRYVGGGFAGPLLAFFYTGTPMPLALMMLTGMIGVYLLSYRAKSVTRRQLHLRSQNSKDN
ncbi:MAG: multidrug effflux MFS transporter [Cellvibrio sp.]